MRCAQKGRLRLAGSGHCPGGPSYGVGGSPKLLAANLMERVMPHNITTRNQERPKQKRYPRNTDGRNPAPLEKAWNDETLE